MFFKRKRGNNKKIKRDNLNEFDFISIQSENSNIHKIIIIAVIVFLFFSMMFVFIRSTVSKKIEEEEFKAVGVLDVVINHPNNLSDISDFINLQYIFKKGDNISDILINKVGADYLDVNNIIVALKGKFNIRSIKVGQELNIRYKKTIKGKSGNVENKIIIDEIKIPYNKELDITAKRKDNGDYVATKNQLLAVKQHLKYKVIINNSLFEDGLKAGVAANILANLIKFLSFDVDFQRDIQKGDSFEVLFEAYYNERGEKIRDGKMLYLSMQMRSNKLEFFRYETVKGNDLLFDSKGRSMQKSLLKTPINGARISSGYGRRKHPILGYNKMHKGVDFAAPRGTPFFAAGSGTITKIGWNGGFGKYIKIKHNKTYSTEYAHIYQYAKGMTVGKRVKQGQVIAYVGSTGRSTGPHLHFGLIYKGKRVNPNRVKSLPNIKLIGREKINFNKEMEKINIYRANIPNLSV